MFYKGYEYTIVRCPYSDRLKAQFKYNATNVVVPIMDSHGHKDRKAGTVLRVFDTYYLPHSEVWSKCSDPNLECWHTSRYFAVKAFKSMVDFRLKNNIPVLAFEMEVKDDQMAQ